MLSASTSLFPAATDSIHSCGEAPLAINLSLPKTGSTSLAASFPPGMSKHEGFHQSSVSHISDYLNGRTDRAELRTFLKRRWKLLKTRVDVATFLHWIPKELFDLWPSSRFLLVVRDPIPWVCSYLGMLHSISLQLNSNATAKELGWIESYGRMQAKLLSVCELSQTLRSESSTQALMIQLIEFWLQRQQSVCEAIPSDQLWAIPFEKLAFNLPAFADWIGCPPSQLRELPTLNTNPSLFSLQTWLLKQAHQTATISGTVRDAIQYHEQLTVG